MTTTPETGGKIARFVNSFDKFTREVTAPPGAEARSSWPRITLGILLIGAFIATSSSAYGMYLYFSTVLQAGVLVSIAFSAFLEIGMVGVALMARSRMIRGENAPVALTATWLLALISGVFAGMHHLVSADDVLNFGPHAVVNAAFRMAPPLLAAGLWHLFLIENARDINPGRTRHQVRRDKHFLEVASISLQLRMEADHPTAKTPKNQARLRDDLRKSYKRLLKTIPATDKHIDEELDAWLTTIGRIDTFAERTRQFSHQATTDIPAIPATPVEASSIAEVGPPQDLAHEDEFTAPDLMQLPLLAAPEIIADAEPVHPEKLIQVVSPGSPAESELIGHSDVKCNVTWRAMIFDRLGPTIRQDPNITPDNLVILARSRGLRISSSAADRWIRDIKAELSTKPELRDVSA